MNKDNNTKPCYDEKGNEIGYTDSEGNNHYYNTPEAREYFTKITGHKFN